MATLSSPDSQDQERDEWIATKEQRHLLASSTRSLLGQVQAIASRGSKSQQAAWHEHIEALVALVCFAERPDCSVNTDRPQISIQQLRTFGALLRDRRNSAGLSRTALARRAKLSDATIKFIETARTPPSRATLIRLLAVPELKLTWDHVPGRLGVAPRGALALVSDTSQRASESRELNCYVTPSFDPVQSVLDFGLFLNGSGGHIDPAAVYLDHQSAAGYLSICIQQAAIQEHRRRLPLASLAKRIVGASGRHGLSVVALGSGEARSEVRLAQHLIEQQQQPDLHLWLVDISQPLLSVGLRHANDALRSRPGVKVRGVQGSFYHLPMFGSVRDLSEVADTKSERRTRVYIMLGGTFDCLDHELRFAEHTIDAKPGDWLVVDVHPAYGPPNDPELIRRTDPLLRSPLPYAYAEWLSSPIRRHCMDVRSIEFSLGLDTHAIIQGSYGVDAIATVQAGEQATTRRFVMFRWKRYDVASLAQSLAQIGWAPIAMLPCGPPAAGQAVAMLFRKCEMSEAAAVGAQMALCAPQRHQRLACASLAPSPARDTPAGAMETGQPNLSLRQPERSSRQVQGRSSLRTAASVLVLGIVLLLGLFGSAPVFGQTTAPPPPAPRPINSTLSFTGGSCGTLFTPCPAISRLGLFVWLSGQYLGTGLAGNPHASTLSGSIDITMEVARRVAVSASIPGALTRIQGQYGDEVWGVGGPLEARARVRLGPASAGFYSIQARPLWSSVVEVRTQFLIPGFDGDPKYVGRVQRGSVQPSLYGAGELNVWRFQFAPGAGILVGDREAHVDLSLRVSVQLLDRLFGDAEALRRQALAVPSEPGRCQSAWMGAVGVRFQLRRGMFLTARYVGGQGDCVPQHSFMLNLGVAFGEEHIRIPTADEAGFIRKWHAILMGMVDPVLDCQGIMRADDGTPMFRFGYPDTHNPSIIWRNHVSYRVGEHFWEKGGHLYLDTDLTHPVLDLYGEAPLSFAERAAMHGCPTLPGLDSPCQVALNLSALRNKIESGGSAVQVALAEDAQIVACLNHLSPLKAAAVFTSIQAALGPLVAKLPQVAGWGNPAAPPSSAPGTPAAMAVAPPHAASAAPSGPPKLTASTHSDGQGQQHRPQSKPGHPQRHDESDEPISGPPHLPALPSWSGGESSRAVADNSPPPATSAKGGSKPQSASPVPSSSTQLPAEKLPSPRGAHNELLPTGAAKALQVNPHQKSPQPASATTEPVAAAPVADEHSRHEPEPAGPLCGTYCKLTLGAAAIGAVVVGGELTKDGIILGTAAAGGNLGLTVAGAVGGGAVTGKIVVDGVADHVTPPSTPTEPTRPVPPEQSTSSADSTASRESTDQDHAVKSAPRKPPNPHGSHGKPDHRAKVDELKLKAEQEYPPPKYEVRSNKELPEKRRGLNRRPDAAAVDVQGEQAKTVKVYEAGRTTQDGQPVARERKKFEEYQQHGIEVEFHPVPKL